MLNAEARKEGVVQIDILSIGIKFETLMQAVFTLFGAFFRLGKLKSTNQICTNQVSNTHHHQFAHK